VSNIRQQPVKAKSDSQTREETMLFRGSARPRQSPERRQEGMQHIQQALTTDF